jgi:F0F1-type ATP synthase assembly protein I
MKLNNDILKALGLINHIAIAMMVPIIICLFIGVYLDNKFDKSPLFLSIFLVIGIAASFRNLYMMTKTFSEDKKKRHKDE